LRNTDFDFLEENKKSLKLLVLGFLIIAFAIYVGYLIYGKRGLNRYIELQETKHILNQEVQKLKKENVKLQKEYFGLKDIEGD